jgi:hypothetical protein
LECMCLNKKGICIIQGSSMCMVVGVWARYTTIRCKLELQWEPSFEFTLLINNTVLYVIFRKSDAVCCAQYTPTTEFINDFEHILAS